MDVGRNTGLDETKDNLFFTAILTARASASYTGSLSPNYHRAHSKDQVTPKHAVDSIQEGNAHLL